jgi:DNA-binding SARP family transcriptional activator
MMRWIEHNSPAGGPVELLLLGPVQASIDGRTVNLGVRKQRLVVAALALDPNHLVSVTRLIQLLWPTDPPMTARGMVHTYVSGLRAVLASTGGHRDLRLDREASSYVLRCDPARIDVRRFRTFITKARICDDTQRITLLDRALALWRGPALAGVAPEEVRLRLCLGLEEERLTAHEDLIDARLRLGHQEGLLPELLALVDEQPHRPRLVGQLMRTLHRTGRAAEALETYRRTQRHLRDEFGLNPPQELQNLHLAILHDDPRWPDGYAAAT